MLVAVELTSLAKSRMPKRLWRRVHYASFALFALTSMHALTAGKDRGSRAFLLTVVASWAVVLVLTSMRISGSLKKRRSAAREPSLHPTFIGAA